MSDLTVCISACGHTRYYKAMRQSVLSVLGRSGFNIFVGHGDDSGFRLPVDSRISTAPIKLPEAPGSRARSFLFKFLSLKKMLEETSSKWVMQMDADAIMVRPITIALIEEALNGNPLGMVEQTTITGSTMTRKDFLDHYRNYSLAWIEPDAAVPRLDSFRYYNTGMVLGLRSEFEKIVAWSLETIGRTGWEHRVGPHIITDQDYFQYWVNNLHPGVCRDLDWRWNHCQHWDKKFPRPEAYIQHYSNFCSGVALVNLWRMRYQRIKSGMAGTEKRT